MPTITLRPRHVLAGLATAATLWGPAAAQAASCPTPSTIPAFAWIGDTNAYFLAPGGDFESGTGWTLNGQATITRRLTYVVYIGSRQLELDTGGIATGSAFCVDATRSHVRVLLKADSSRSSLKVDAVSPGRVTTLAVVSGARFGDYSVSDFLPFAIPLGLATGATLQAQLRFTSLSGNWKVDGIWVDPRRSG